MNDDLDQLPKNLKLRRMRDILHEELERAEKKKPSYSVFLARVLREEYQHQQVRFLEYRIDRANLPERWSLETFPWKQQPGVSKPQVEQLAELDFIRRAANLVFIGNTGVGKTGLASAILLKALQHGYRGLFIKAQDLFDDMYRKGTVMNHACRNCIVVLAKCCLALALLFAGASAHAADSKLLCFQLRQCAG